MVPRNSPCSARGERRGVASKKWRGGKFGILADRIGESGHGDGAVGIATGPPTPQRESAITIHFSSRRGTAKLYEGTKNNTCTLPWVRSD